MSILAHCTLCHVTLHNNASHTRIRYSLKPEDGKLADAVTRIAAPGDYRAA